jgi:alanyl-tRNA synthetase
VKTADEVRSAFLSFFEARDHRVVRSSSLVPAGDPTLLFANAGMNQFKDLFLGKEKRDYRRAASSQKCVRAGGKHNDLENVGRTARHHTFFEMLGNFSFGDYFKREAIAYSWEFLTVDLELPKERLQVTVFVGDEGVPRDAEACDLWTGFVPAERIQELGAKENFWAMGDTGPCGPCSEIHFYQGDDHPCAEEEAGRACLGVECECDRWLEIWNLVFMQYDRSASGRLLPLPAPCVDTGMGLERIAAVVQGKLSNYETDLFLPLLTAVADRAGRPYGTNPDADVSLRVLADHLRAMTFLVADGVMPANEGRGYVLRKIMRRAMRHGRHLGLERPFLHEASAAVVRRMASAYPQLLNEADTVTRVILAEEERFGHTLKHALAIFEQVASDLPPGGTIAGPDAFRLYDTYGLPADFTEELAQDRGLGVDTEGFAAELSAQQDRARQASKLGVVSGDPTYLTLLEKGRIHFLGYDTMTVDDARIVALLKDGAPTPRLERGDRGEIVLDLTPFYADAGGQVGDHGVISVDGSAAEVVGCRLPVPGLYVHDVLVKDGGFESGMTVTARVDPHVRAGTMRNHTGTHLLHAALREVLGPHVKQAGSLVTHERLRFDFSHYAPVDSHELRHVENRVNEEILRDVPVETRLVGREEALAGGALAFFGDKYGERVRVVRVGGFSQELCGGTHVGRTGEIGLFLITVEQGIAAGTRRLEALSGEGALRRAQENQSLVQGLERVAKTPRHSLVDEHSKLQERLKAQQRAIQGLKMELARGATTGAMNDLEELNGIRVWTPRFDDLDRKAHAAVVDDFRNRQRDDRFLVLSSSLDAKGVHVIAAVSPSLVANVKASEILKRLGLRGGGRGDFAQGGGVERGEVDGMRQRARDLLRSLSEDLCA